MDQIQNIEELNYYLSEKLINYNYNEYIKTVQYLFHKNLDINIINELLDLLNLSKYANNFIINYNHLIKYNIITIYDDIEKVLQNFGLTENIEYIQIINFLTNQKEYQLSSNGFGICLKKLNPSLYSAQYYLFLEHYYKMFNNYREMYNSTNRVYRKRFQELEASMEE